MIFQRTLKYQLSPISLFIVIEKKYVFSHVIASLLICSLSTIHDFTLFGHDLNF